LHRIAPKKSYHLPIRRDNRLRLIIGATAAVLLLLFGGFACADDIQEPSDPLAKAAFDVLNRHCARCHQEGRLIKREKPAKDFGNMLKLDEIAANPDRVLPGNFLASPIVKKIVNKEMPQDYWEFGITDYGNPPPSQQDLEALKAWIEDLGRKPAVASCDTRKPIRNTDVVGFIVADLDRQLPGRRRGARYLTLTNLYNSCASESDMNVYRLATIKLVNSLARLSSIAKLEPIDPEKTILRINIDDLGWDDADWETVLSVYPYGTRPANSSLNTAIENSTHTKLAYVRADWFAFTASRPPLYNRLLNLPKTFQELERQQHVDVTGDIRRLIAKRAGFQKSGVSENNRLIERHPSPSGYFWTSYDFGSNEGRKSLFEFPLGPGGDFGFLQDGGETIFSLPNGFQAYYLNNAKGDELDKGPVNIVRDQERARDGRDPSVIIGFSCMGCHYEGMKTNKDEVREFVLSGRAVFPKTVRDTIAELHPPTEEMDRILADDRNTFITAMLKAGIKTVQDGKEVPLLQSNGVEIIVTLSNRYERNLDVKTAAAEFGMTKDEFVSAVAGGAEAGNRLIIRRLDQAAVPRDQFEKNFLELSQQISDDEILAANLAPPIAVARVAANPSDLSLTSDRNSYKQNHYATFTVVSAEDCFLTVLDVDKKGAATVLFPNKFSQSNHVRGGVPIQLPDNNAYQFRMKDKGIETVTAICTEQNVPVDGITHDFSRSAYTTVPNYTSSISRSIAVEAAGPSHPSQGRARETGRTAIKIEVF
jgi:Domain of unknown function (DUF4384)